MNPYITGFPVSPQIFSGRWKERKLFRGALAQTAQSVPPSPQNIAITGGWGIGKTSLLNKCLLDGRKENFLIVKVTLSPEKCKSMEELVANTIDSFYQAIWQQKNLSAKIKSKFSQWKIEGLELLGIKVSKKKPKPATASTVLTQKLIELWDILQEDLPGIILAFDDLQYLSRFCPDGLYDIRAIFQDTREAGVRSMLMVTGDKSLFAHLRGLSEPLLRFFEQIPLKPFPEEEAKEALNLPLKTKDIALKFDKTVEKNLFEKTERHPYFLTFFAHDLFEYKPKGRITKKFFERIYPEIIEHLGATRFINDIAIASEQEREILFSFCQKETLTTQDIDGLSNPSMFFKRLEEKGILLKVRRGSYALYHPLFREYLRIYQKV